MTASAQASQSNEQQLFEALQLPASPLTARVLGAAVIVALADLRRWDAAGLESALRGLGTTRDMVVDLNRDLAVAIPTGEAWKGSVPDTACAAYEGLRERLRQLAPGMTPARAALADAAVAFATIPAELRRADDLAARTGP